MKTKLVLIGAFALSILAAILLTVGPGGTASEKTTGAYQPAVKRKSWARRRAAYSVGSSRPVV